MILVVSFSFDDMMKQDPHGSITPSPLENMRGLEYYLHDMMHNNGGDVGGGQQLDHLHHHHQQHSATTRGDTSAFLFFRYY